MPRVSSLPLKPADQPSPLDSALAEAGRVLSERERLFRILCATSQSIPALLADRMAARAAIGMAEVHTDGDKDRVAACLADIESELASAVQGRAGAKAALEAQEQDLSEALASLDAARAAYAASVIGEFQQRYTPALQQFLRLWHEGRVLSAALRAPVPMQLPYLLTGAVKACFIAKEDTRVEMLLPDNGEPTEPAIDATAEKIGHQMDNLTSALNHCQGIIAARSRNLPSLSSNLPFSASGTYKVLRTFNCSLTGVAFPVGALIDCSLVAVRELQRLVAVRYIVLVDGGASGASSAEKVA